MKKEKGWCVKIKFYYPLNWEQKVAMAKYGRVHVATSKYARKWGVVSEDHWNDKMKVGLKINLKR